MKLTKKVQYGLLLMIYLCDNKKTSVDKVAKHLNVPEKFLIQIAKELRRQDFLHSAVGNKGGYEIKGNPSVGDIIFSLTPTALITDQEAYNYGHSGVQEDVSLLHFVGVLWNEMAKVLDTPVRNLTSELEMYRKMTDSLGEKELMN